jgi:hypothetical protein
MILAVIQHRLPAMNTDEKAPRRWFVSGERGLF